MMFRWLLAALLVLVAAPAYAACSGSSPSLTAASASEADVSACVSIAVDGDTINIPAGSATWTSNLSISAAITLKGASCTLDGNSRATACTTIIKDNNTSHLGILTFNLVANKATRLTQIEFQDGGSQATGHVNIIGSTQDSRTMRIDHTVGNDYDGNLYFFQDVIGVSDHNTFTQTGASPSMPYYFYNAAWGGYTFADGSFADANHFGSSSFFFVENNTINFSGAVYAIADAYRGARYVVRFNDIINGWVEMHGTDSGGRRRGTRAVEAYNNAYTCNRPGGPCTYTIFSRSGSFMTFNNTLTGFSSGFTPRSEMVYDRLFWAFSPFDVADGTNTWDLNVGGGPFDSGTAKAGSGDLLLVDNTKSWTAHAYIGYSVKQTSGCDEPPYCASIIIENTATSLTLESQFTGNPLHFTSGDSYQIWKVDQGFDMPGRALGTRLFAQPITSATSSGATATVTLPVTLASLGWITGDVIAIAENSCLSPTCTEYNGVFPITATGASTFTYMMTGSTAASAQFVGVATKAPAANDQSDDPSYAWSNSQSTTNIVSVSAYPLQIRENKNFYNYGGAVQTTSSFPFSGSPSTDNGVGVGTAARKPSTCTTGVFYWATDQGSWNSSGSGGNGLGYHCTATNTWTQDYTPYAYPHPLISGCVPDHLTFTAQPFSVAVNVSLGSVTISIDDSGGNNCPGATDTITIANKGGTCLGMNLGGTKFGAASGSFTTTNLTEDVAGACTLSAAASGLTGADSSAFMISAAGIGGGSSKLHGR